MRAPSDLSPEDQRRRDELHALLTTDEGNIAAVARALRKARVQIQRWMARYGLVREEFERR